VSDLGQLYQAAILDHHKRPRNAGRLVDATHTAEGHNPLCGDRLTLGLRLVEGVVLDVACEVSGCAICRASGSMLTEAIVGSSAGDVRLLAADFLSKMMGTSVAEGPAPGWPPALDALLHVRHFPSRMRCATLAWDTLQRALPGS
jgi:nitrogen fixation protein NifU and related proteins